MIAVAEAPRVRQGHTNASSETGTKSENEIPMSIGKDSESEAGE